MKKKILLLSAGLVVLALAGAFWWFRRPQSITFGDDSKITLLSIDYGKHHVPPSVKLAPGPGRGGNRAHGGAFNTTEDTLVTWIRQEYIATNWHNFDFYISDAKGTGVSRGSATHSGSGRTGNEIIGVEFPGFPRRESRLFIEVTESSNVGQETGDKKFTARNPGRGSFAAWKAGPLPATATDDDLSVTLTKLVTDVESSFARADSDADDPINKSVQATFHVERNGKAVSNWQPVSVTTSDATGNRVSGWIGQNNWQNGDDVVSYQYGLWPGELWKVRLEFSQQSDFSNDELWAVPNVPLLPGRQQDMWNNMRNQRTNTAFAENDLLGVHFKVFPGRQFTDVSGNSNPQGGLFLQLAPPPPEGTRLTIKFTDSDTNEIEHWDYGSSRNNNAVTYRYGLRDVSGMTNLNLTIALHRSRFVEFTAQPERSTETENGR